VLDAEVLDRGVAVVGAAAESDALGRVTTPPREGLGVMELEGVARVAAATGCRDERAAAAVALRDFAAHCCGDVPGTRRTPRFGIRVLPRSVGFCEARASHVPQQRRERVIEDRRQIAVGNAVAQQRLRFAQLRVRSGVRSELHLGSTSFSGVSCGASSLTAAR
jgi:hypothetical protein